MNKVLEDNLMRSLLYYLTEQYQFSEKQLTSLTVLARQLFKSQVDPASLKLARMV
jgi:hypothetical protein